ncbi:MAG: hypothetical protein PHV34_08095 [Verrucomicrobiae bacterium]|nr:hypothetical protein [Verrucomicrobiae bacterium]
MKNGVNIENLNYEIFPMVVPAGRKSRITIRPLYEHSPKFNGKMKLFHAESEWLGRLNRKLWGIE